MKKSLFEKLSGNAKNETPVSVPVEKEEGSESYLYQNVPASGSSEAQDAEGQLTIDVYQTDADIVIKSTVAGVAPDDIDITITNDMITIRGKRERDEEVAGENYYYQECYWGSFSRSVILPVDVEADKVEASLKNGILTVRLPKAERERTKKVRVKSA